MALADMGTDRDMARFEGKFEADGSEPVELEQLLALLRSASAGSLESREHARACYLSLSDGWREAVKELGGAFAETGAAIGPIKK